MVNFVCIVFELGDKMLTLSSMENLIVQCNHMTFVQIGEFDWLSERQKGPIFVKMFKNLLLRNHIGDEAETWHTCLGH